MHKTVTIVVPIFNEEDNVEKLVYEINKLQLPYQLEILFVNDGSSDGTITKIQAISAIDKQVKYISFVKNFGHQMALKAGLDHAHGDCVISMDGDLQHPPSLIPTLLQQWEAGFDVVITQRIDNEDLGMFKKLSSKLFYKIMNQLSTIPIRYGEADFRLLDKKVVQVLKKINEPDMFYRGLIRWVGFKQTTVSYTAERRFAGKSKYTFSKMVALALNGISSFSTKPLYMSIYIGFCCALVSILVLFYALISYFSNAVIPGWTSTLIIMSFFSGIQLMVLGVVGLYIGKLFMQSKNRPLYIIADNTLENHE